MSNLKDELAKHWTALDKLEKQLKTFEGIRNSQCLSLMVHFYNQRFSPTDLKEVFAGTGTYEVIEQLIFAQVNKRIAELESQIAELIDYSPEEEDKDEQSRTPKKK